jgi:release factor glutamine methyltransferase
VHDECCDSECSNYATFNRREINRREKMAENSMVENSIADNVRQSSLLDAVSDSARLDTEILLAYVLDKNRTYLYTWPEKSLIKEQQDIFDQLMQRRLTGEPIAYIVGEKEFWSLALWVNKSTLIPRPDTEVVVETALSLFAEDTSAVKRKVIDLGTGTGAIALALASEKPHWDIVAADNSLAACELANRNKQRHQLDNVTVLCSDWLAAVDLCNVDMIVSNPPYIEESDPHLSQGDVRFEPHGALTAKNNGLADIEIIAQQARQVLRSSGWLLIEHGYQQSEAVTEIMQDNEYTLCRTVNDMAGQPRMTMGRLIKERFIHDNDR